MHTKIVAPRNNSGKAFYDNQGSSARLTNYMNKEFSESDLFFNSERKDISKTEVHQTIDKNVKGLKAGEEKFHALIISPSQDELAFIGNSSEKLRAFTNTAMDRYAESFKRSDLKKEDLVWFGVLHHSREYSQNDVEISKEIADMKASGKDLEGIVDHYENKRYKGSQTKPAKGNIYSFYNLGVVNKGDPKHGLQTHIHVIVSARDKSMKKNVHPIYKTGFDKKGFLVGVEESFNKMFGYGQSNETEHKLVYIKAYNRIKGIKEKYGLTDDYFNVQELSEAFNSTNDKKNFLSNLEKLDRGFKRNEFPYSVKRFLEQPFVDERTTRGKSIAESKERVAQSIFSSLGSGFIFADPVFSGNDELEKALQKTRRRKKKLKELEQERGRG